MTVRFRPVEANELVDDERAAQRIYMGSAMTMEPGEHARSLAPCRRSCLQHTSATPPTSAANHPAPSFSPSLSSSTARNAESIALVCRLLTSSCPTAMLETALFVSSSTVPVPLYQQDACLVVQCNVGHPAFVSRARSPVYHGDLHIAQARGAILAVHLITCSGSWPIANVSI
jgi:hypothetical protein